MLIINIPNNYCNGELLMRSQGGATVLATNSEYAVVLRTSNRIQGSLKCINP